MLSGVHVSGEDGYSLIEVMVALLVLSVGLLGLEALGIRAARSIALADRQSRYVTLATDSLESALHQLRRRNVPPDFCRTDLPFGDRMSRQTDLSDPRLARVIVRVIPNPDSSGATPDIYEISSSQYLVVILPSSPAGAPCS